MRFLCGMAIGGLTVGFPLYLSELAPATLRGRTLRGRLISLFQVKGRGRSGGCILGRIYATGAVQGPHQALFREITNTYW